MSRNVNHRLLQKSSNASAAITLIIVVFSSLKTWSNPINQNPCSTNTEMKETHYTMAHQLLWYGYGLWLCHGYNSCISCSDLNPASSLMGRGGGVWSIFSSISCIVSWGPVRSFVEMLSPSPVIDFPTQNVARNKTCLRCQNPPTFQRRHPGTGM